MLKLIGLKNFEAVIKTWPDATLVLWSNTLETLITGYDSTFYSDFYKMLELVRRECVVRLGRRVNHDEVLESAEFLEHDKM